MESRQMPGCRVRRWARLFSVCLAAAVLLAAGIAAESSYAKDQRQPRAAEFVESRLPGEPVVAVVSLRSQSITVYDADGWVARAPVSSGERGRETPSGVFSVIQKDADHHSNLYDDAVIPLMLLVTCSRIALPGGIPPEHRASQRCVRMRFVFVAR